MTYLQLINQVLRRLREADITSTQVDSNPHLRMIGTCVNDAKDAVENAWRWSHLRGEDSVVMTPGDPVVTLPSSADTHYIVFNVRNYTQSYWLDEVGADYMASQYPGSVVPEGSPTYYAPYYNDNSGNLQLRVYPAPAAADTLKITRSKHQAMLTDHGDVLLVPSLPVYTLATALASRERGEIGGTPTSELFAIADSHLSDAIAIDADRYSDEGIWYVASNMQNSNVRG